MKFGAEPKKAALLGGLLVVAGGVYYYNSQDPDLERARLASAPASRPAAPAPVTAPSAPRQQQPRRSGSAGPRTVQEYRPSLKPRKPEDRPDPATIDPTLRLDLLAKLQDVKMEGGERSLFEFSQAPKPKQPDPPKIIPKPVQDAKDGAAPGADGKPAAPDKAPPPPITLKFYGFIGGPRMPAKKAFFLDGEEILVGTEGELLKKRYKIVRIGLNSVVVEDTQHKHQQTLVLEEQPG